MVKKVAMYGVYNIRVPVRQRVWMKRKDGVRQRYWKTTRRLKTVRGTGRYEFYGKPKELALAIRKAYRFLPRKFVTVSAMKFVRHPEKYGFEGKWLERTVDS